MSEDLRPVSIEYLADKFYNLDITFITASKNPVLSETEERTPGVFIDLLEKVTGPFWFQLKRADDCIVRTFQQGRLPTIEMIEYYHGKGIYKACISEPEKQIREMFFTI